MKVLLRFTLHALPKLSILITTRTTTRSCRDPETAVSNFWSPGAVRGRPQRVPSAAAAGGAVSAGAAAGAAGAAVYPNG